MLSRNKITILVIVVSLAILAWISTIAFINRDNGSVKMIIAPSELTVRYGNVKKNMSYGSVLSLNEGKFTLLFERTGFESVKKVVTVKKGEEQSVYVSLRPISDAAHAIMESEANQSHKEEVVGHEISEGGQEIDRKNPILKILPILERNYTVTACSIPDGYTGPGQDKDIAVCIDALTDNSYNIALDEVKKKGYDLTQYLVIRK